MQIEIEIVAVDVINKGKYKVAEVTHKQNGKTNTKKVMSFGAQEKAFKFLSSSNVKKGDTYSVEIEKNADGYWDWLSVRFPSADNGEDQQNTVTSSTTKTTPAPNRGNYETPEERAARQMYIVRQSSLTNAIAFLNHTKKSYEVAEIITLAKEFVDFVFNDPIIENDSTDNSISDIDDDIPF